MAERRMFTKKITDADEFVSLPSSTQALYLHLTMSADDDGFNNQVQMAMFKAHASVDDLKVLLAKRFIIQFSNGVIVIKHWRMANALRKDRYTATAYQEELKMLKIKDNGAYALVDDALVTERLPDGCQTVAADKNSIDKISKEESNKLSGKPDAGQKEEYGEDIKTIIAYLNEKAKKNYRPSSEANKKLIRARLKEGYTVTDFQKVIDIKTIEWLGTSQEQYLRPETLFCSKHFESYLNQNNASQVKQNTNQQKNISAMAEIIKELEAKGE